MFKKVAFTMYPVKEMARARKFYEETLGLKATEEYVEGKWVEYDLEQGGCFAITAMVPDLEPSATGGGSIAFEVEDIAALMADLKEKGVTVKMDTFQSPVCRMAVVIDSEGNTVMLHQVNKKD
jgi:predicted enzyme related to lactoylglutathione lyase